MSKARSALVVMVGTKAQFIKTAPILVEFDRRGVDYRLVYTGQHSETFEALEACFGTRPADDNMVPGKEADTATGLLGWAFRFCIAAVKRLRRREWRSARWGVVHGDTASTLLSAIALRMAGVPVAHVEAGLRSPSLFSPFPEEIVRRLVSRIASLHLAPDSSALANLSGVRGRVVDTGGNSLRDCLALALHRLASQSLQPGAGGYALVSVHRSENLSNKSRLDKIVETIIETASRIPVRFVLHPVTRARLQKTGWWGVLASRPGIELIDRMNYVDFVQMMLGAKLLMTDGGSNQEEAAMLGLPTLLLRTETERADGLASGVVELSMLDNAAIQDFVGKSIDRVWAVKSLPSESPSSRIVDELSRP